MANSFHLQTVGSACASSKAPRSAQLLREKIVEVSLWRTPKRENSRSRRFCVQSDFERMQCVYELHTTLIFAMVSWRREDLGYAVPHLFVRIARPS